jgi:hypothetical protein
MPAELPMSCDLRRFVQSENGRYYCALGRSARAVHPRAWGEHLIARDVDSDYNGSSPRVWGTPPLWKSDPQQQRFIPGRARLARPGGTWRQPASPVMGRGPGCLDEAVATVRRRRTRTGAAARVSGPSRGGRRLSFFGQSGAGRLVTARRGLRGLCLMLSRCVHHMH